MPPTTFMCRISGVHHLHEKLHRGPIYRVLPRFIVGRLLLDQCAITLPCSPQRRAELQKNSIDVVQQIPDKSALYGILRAHDACFWLDTNPQMDKRLLIYHALLLEKHDLPILSVLVSPFEVSMVTSPLRETWGDEEILCFHYQTLPLWKLDARTYVEQGAVPIYGLLPTMQGTSDELLLQAINEMVEYYGDDEAHLRDELLCFRVLLSRAQRLPEAEMLRVERRIRMFDPLLENDPWVKEKVAESKVRGKAEGIAEGELEAFKRVLLEIVQTRFPALIDLAKTTVARTTQPDALNVLVVQISAASDEQAARSLLEKFSAS